MLACATQYETYDSARHGTATLTPRSKFRQGECRIILPLIALIFGTVFTFADLSVVYLLTKGGPVNSAQVLGSLGFEFGILSGDVSLAQRSACSCSPSCWWRWWCCCFALRRGEVSRDHARPPRRRRRLVLHRSDPAGTVRRLLLDVDHHLQDRRDLYNLQAVPYWFNGPLTLEHLEYLFDHTLFLRWPENTAVIGVCVVAITLVVSLPAGYRLARMPGRSAENLGIGISLTYLVPPTLSS